MSGLSAPRILFGVHSLSPYSRADFTPYGILKVIGSASMTMQASVEQLYGGAQKFSWAAESKTISADISAKVKAYPGFLFTQFLGGTVVDNAGEATASVTELVAGKGTSAIATTGMASVGVKSGSEAQVKFAKYLIKVVSATTVDVYAYSDIDFNRPTAAVYQNDLLKITATALTITASTAVDIPGTGIQITGGSGTIAMITGDTATFSSRPENASSSDIVIGQASTSLPAFGAVILAQKRATSEMFEVTAFNCVASGFPIAMDEMAFSTTELKVTCVYDSVQDAVYKIRAVVPLS